MITANNITAGSINRTIAVLLFLTLFMIIPPGKYFYMQKELLQNS
jgi:hypothetical protein